MWLYHRFSPGTADVEDLLAERGIVVSGKALVTNGEEQIKLQPNQSAYIPSGNKHRLENPGTERLILIEIQCGSYLGEDDIVRYEDVYGR